MAACFIRIDVASTSSKNEAICFVALRDVLLEIHQKGPCPIEPVETNQPKTVKLQLILNYSDTPNFMH